MRKRSVGAEKAGAKPDAERDSPDADKRQAQNGQSQTTSGVSVVRAIMSIYLSMTVAKYVGRVAVRFVDPPHKTIVSCTPEMPLVERYTDYMDPEVFSRMQQCLVGHPKITSNSLNPEGFVGTRGFVLRFSGEKGVERFYRVTKFNCGEDGFHPLIPFFERARHPDSNAFVLNVLVCDKPTSVDDLIVNTHVDDTLGHDVRNTQFLAHTVSVLYVSVPDDMTGGELRIRGNETIFDEDKILDSIKPHENTMAAFRGDSYHEVNGYDTQTDKVRLSLVLEQYKVDDRYVDYLTEYEESTKDGMKMF